ncbi:DUF1934 domain-containing protein [Pullulanibacillus sp. KACC 23026]|uniref:DUF1934 domain-containing protein n=1 Tax=Pullulanibacillus sp. KACC 23026 TaxID=3028315 RepID=UPI0023B01DA0|nr:DUF1934 domain-containing protein [Pullulanibacillus sp. KACC 23026]WEG13077.1 DUF1934 domain-containing protein [Pullulanibacillus sp. KACC 23026]
MLEDIQVAIDFTSRRKHPNEPAETIRSSMNGQLQKKGASFYLSYVESTPELGQMTHMIKLADDQALIMRKGTTNMRLPLTLGEETTGQYQSPVGPFVIAATMKAYEFNWDEKTGDVLITYVLHLQNEFAGEFSLQFKLKAI